MRTRFLNADYFFTAQSPDVTLRDFKLLSLPPPPLSPSDPPFVEEFPYFDLGLSIDSEIDRFPIERALSQFLSDVIPQFCEDCALSGEREQGEFRSGTTEIEFYESVANFLCEEKEAGKYSDFRTGDSEIRDRKGSERLKDFQFEMVEVDFPLRESERSSEVEEAGLSFKVPSVKIPLDNVDTTMGVTITYPYKVARSICSIEDIPAYYHIDLDCCSVKDGSSSLNQILKHAVTIPQFEISEIDLGLERSLFMNEAFSFSLPILEHRHGTYTDEAVVNSKEFLESTNIDILEQFLAHAEPEQCIEDEPISLSSVMEMDLVNLNGTMLLEENSAIYPIMSAGGCSYSPCSVQFQEVQVLETPVHNFELFSSSQAMKEPDKSEQMFKDDMDSAKSFYESIVSSELALVDDTFKSLPVPVFFDDKDTISLSMIFGGIIYSLRPHLPTACDGLYLDWHPLLEETCNHEICSTYMSMLQEVSSYNITSEPEPTGEDMVSVDSESVDVTSEKLTVLQSKEVLPELHGSFPPSDMSAKSASTQILKDDISMLENERKIPNVNSEKISSLFESMSQSNDLNFFLDVRRGNAGRIYKGETILAGSGKVTSSAVFLEDQSGPPAFPEVNIEQWDIKVHQVSISDHILGLMDHIQRNYLVIIENDMELRRNTMFSTTNYLGCLCLSKQELLELMVDKGESRDEAFMGLLALYATKQLAYLLCFFGIHTAHTYMCNLKRNMQSELGRIRPLKLLIEDAHWKADKQLIESHPSLTVIEGILTPNTSQNGNKILIVADRLFWLPLYQKLTHMKIKSHEVRNAYELKNHSETADGSGFTNYVLGALAQADCLLISHENISASFPFNKFSIILEYGGPYSLSRVSSISPKMCGIPRIQFIKVNMENHSMPKALCEGFDVSQNLLVERVLRSMPGLQGILKSDLAPTEKTSCFSSESENILDASHDNESSMTMPHSSNFKNMSSTITSSPDVVIVVNTQTLDKEMLISRRSSYQKILALEKGNVQVVEREINLPLDLIFSAAVCLVWYEARNLRDITTGVSSIPKFMDTIATNVLMSLSFAFSGCILIFEGESSFLSAIMESSDALYAAAASLDLNLQLFCSYMPESTDEIILSCIRNATRFNKGVYPPMPESETLGESFLTRFPSINPLSAHAILTSGGMLIEFLEWSQERRIQAVGKYHVPDESISLFNALCRYGEMAESKSVMTECSYTDSDISSGNMQSEGKSKKHAMSHQNHYVPVDDSFYIEPLNQSKDRISELSRSSESYQSREFLSIHHTKKTESNQFSIGDTVRKRELYPRTASNLDHDCTNVYRQLNEAVGDEPCYHSSSFLDESCPSLSSTIRFSGRPEPRSDPAILSSVPDRAFSLSGRRTFPTSAEINCGTDNWTFVEDMHPSFEGTAFGQKAACSNEDNTLKKHQREHLNGSYMPKCPISALRFPNQDKVSPFLGRSRRDKISPLYRKSSYSKATQSSRLQCGPQQTFEFPHKTNDKRETHQQNLTCNSCLSCPGSTKKKAIAFKSQSPSIIDSYRYQGGSQIMEITYKKLKKQGKAQVNSNSVEKKDSSFIIPPTWTPIDKRARQHLSFLRTGNEKQSKLVWRNRYNSPGTSGSLRKRYRDEV